MITPSYIERLTYKINGACIEVHKIIGPRLAGKCISKMPVGRIYITRYSF